MFKYPIMIVWNWQFAAPIPLLVDASLVIVRFSETIYTFILMYDVHNFLSIV